MHFTDIEKAAVESWGLALLLQPSAQLFFKPSFNPTQFLLFLSLLVRNRWQIPLYHQALESVTHYIKVGGSRVFAVFFWGFLRNVWGCIWTDSKIGIGWFLESLQREEDMQHVHIYWRGGKNRLSRFDIWYFPATLRWSIFIRQLSHNWLPRCFMISR